MLRQLGVNPIRPEYGLEALEAALLRGASQIAIMDVDWSRWRALNPVSAGSPRLAPLTETAHRQRAEPALLAQLRSLETKDRLEMATLLLAELLARTLRLPAERVDLHRPLTDIGLDSLMMVEMRVAIQRDFGVEFSTTELHGRQDLTRVADRLLNRAGLN
jgi:acyl carrier protein